MNTTTDTIDVCVNCRYYVPTEMTDTGVCHRYPRVELVRSAHWCGEFTQISFRALETK